MQPQFAAQRLQQIAEHLDNLYTQIGEIERRETLARAHIFQAAYQQGEGVTASMELSKHQVADDVADKGQKKAQVLGLIEERDMLKFAAEQGWLEWL